MFGIHEQPSPGCGRVGNTICRRMYVCRPFRCAAFSLWVLRHRNAAFASLYRHRMCFVGLRSRLERAGRGCISQDVSYSPSAFPSLQLTRLQLKNLEHVRFDDHCHLCGNCRRQCFSSRHPRRYFHLHQVWCRLLRRGGAVRALRVQHLPWRGQHDWGATSVCTHRYGDGHLGACCESEATLTAGPSFRASGAPNGTDDDDDVLQTADGYPRGSDYTPFFLNEAEFYGNITTVQLAGAAQPTNGTILSFLPSVPGPAVFCGVVCDLTAIIFPSPRRTVSRSLPFNPICVAVPLFGQR